MCKNVIHSRLSTSFEHNFIVPSAEKFVRYKKQFPKLLMQNFKRFDFVLPPTEIKVIFGCESLKDNNIKEILNLSITKNVGANSS